MKVELRIPATEPYAYIGIDLLDDEILTNEKLDTVIDDYRRATARLRSLGGIPVTDFENFVLKQLEGNGNTIEEYNQMSDSQKETVQMIKRLKKRIAYKLKKNPESNPTDKDSLRGITGQD